MFLSRIATKWAIATAAVGPLWLAQVARAAEEAGEHHASPGLFTGDIGNIIWTLITFIAVIVVLGKFAWGPILRGLQSREQFIQQSLADADAANRKATEQLAEYTKKLEQARSEAQSIVEEARKHAEQVKHSIHEEARKEADSLIGRAKREIDLARDAAVKELYATSATLATDAASKIIGKELNPSDHERLIEESIAELRRQRAEQN